jgi:hypothetical protein
VQLRGKFFHPVASILVDGGCDATRLSTFHHRLALLALDPAYLTRQY